MVGSWFNSYEGKMFTFQKKKKNLAQTQGCLEVKCIDNYQFSYLQGVH